MESYKGTDWIKLSNILINEFNDSILFKIILLIYSLLNFNSFIDRFIKIS